MTSPETTAEKRLSAMADHLGRLTLDEIEQQPIRFAWVRRREVVQRGVEHWMSAPTVDAFELWLEDPPGEPERTADEEHTRSSAVARRLVEYERWARA
jgi:hypothetical protein